MRHGWSSLRGRARHIIDEMGERGMCGAPIRIASTLSLYPPPTQKKLRKLEVCDHCQNAKRRLKVKA